MEEFHFVMFRSLCLRSLCVGICGYLLPCWLQVIKDTTQIILYNLSDHLLLELGEQGKFLISIELSERRAKLECMATGSVIFKHRIARMCRK